MTCAYANTLRLLRAARFELVQSGLGSVSLLFLELLIRRLLLLLLGLGRLVLGLRILGRLLGLLISRLGISPFLGGSIEGSLLLSQLHIGVLLGQGGLVEHGLLVVEVLLGLVLGVEGLGLLLQGVVLRGESIVQGLGCLGQRILAGAEAFDMPVPGCRSSHSLLRILAALG